MAKQNSKNKTDFNANKMNEMVEQGFTMKMMGKTKKIETKKQGYDDKIGT